MAQQRSRKKVIKEPKKKGRHGWATDDQVAFLTALITTYMENKAVKTLPDFWPPVFEKWFEQWPITVSNTTANAGSPDQNENSEGETSDKEKATNSKEKDKSKKRDPLNLWKKVSVDGYLSIKLYLQSR